MAGNSTISITFKLDGDDASFKKLASNADGLKKILSGVMSESEKLRGKIIDFAAISTGLDQFQRSISQVQGIMKGLSDAYQIQKVAETQLETVMRQRMNATEAQINSIKQLASAQQELGVIGDEVQLSGAQQVATFLKQKQSLDVLIPAMNNLLAQQKGLTATNQDAIAIGNLMGKAMQGQVAALRRVGITFDASQEAVMKFGTESQRASMLAQIITQNVGDMNAQLANTDVGRQKQLENTLGDIKEQMGALVQGVLPYVTAIASSTTAVTGLFRITLGLKTVTMALASAATRSLHVLGLSFKAARQFVIDFNYAVKGGTEGLKLFAICFRQTLIATGVGIAIAAVTTAIMYLTSATDEATESTNKFNGSLSEMSEQFREGQKEVDDYGRQIRDISQKASEYADKEMANLKKLYDAATDETLARDKRLQAVSEMQSLYPDVLGKLSAEAIMVGKASSEYDKLTESIITAARARAAYELRIANQKELLTLDLQMMQLQQEEKELDKEEDFQASEHNKAMYFVRKGISPKKNAEKSRAAKEATHEIVEKQYNNSLEQAKNRDKRAEIEKADAYLATIQGDYKPGSRMLGNVPKKTASSTLRNASSEVEEKKLTEVNESAATLKEINDNIDFLQGKLQNSTLENAEAINKEIAQWEKKADAIRNAGKAVEEAPKYTPAPVADVKTIQEATDAISYYDEKIRLANDEERTGLVKVRAEYEKLLESFNRPITAQGIQDMLDSLKGLSREEYVIKIQAIGLDAIEDYIKQIEKMLSDPNLPEGMTKWLSSMKEDLVGISKDKSFSKLSKKAEQAYSAVGDLGGAFKNLGSEIGAPILDIAGTMMQAIATMVLSFSKAMEGSTAMGPWGWIAFAATGLATLTSVVASVKSLPKFAEGGVISGPTVGLMGEYAGAANNPEVVAPLNKLKDLLQPEGVPAMGGKVVFEISGRNLRGVLQRVDKLSSRS